MKKKSKKIFVLGVVLSFCFSLLSVLPVEAAGGAAQKVNINKASLDELQTLPGIGVKIAQRIIDFRDKNGPFKRIEELMKVKGIGEKMFERMKEKLTVGPEK
ncbi:MAG: helix-hairpin-helix domain-containing protein [Candidatus Aminicenantes bacterium]|nr:helix-hairpin-helix domain-containing protein [Candidatus Aminicenantes bacterium]